MADIWNSTEQGLKAARDADKNRDKAQNKSKILKGVIADDSYTAGYQAEQEGNEPIPAMVQAETEVRAEPDAATGEYLKRQTTPTFQRTGLGGQIAAEREQQLRDAEERRQSVDWTDSFKASWNDSSATQWILDAAQRESFQPDASFDYMENRKELEAGLTPANVDWLRSDSVSLAHAQQMRAQALEEQQQQADIFAGGLTQGITSMLAAGLADPVGWAAGFGVGKAFQMGAIGSRALYQAGRTGAAAGSIVAEGAIGNVAISGVLDASGKRVDAADYAMAAGMGGLMGLGMSPLVLRGPQANIEHTVTAGNSTTTVVGTQEAVDNFKQIIANSSEQNAKMYAQALDAVGPGASVEQIAREVHRIQVDELTWVERARTAAVPTDEVFLRRGPTRPQEPVERATPNEGGDPELRAAEDAYEAGLGTSREGDPVLRAQEDAYEARLDSDPELTAAENAYEQRVAARQQSFKQGDEEFDFRLNTDEAQAEASQRYGTDLLRTDDPNKAAFINEVIYNAQRFNEANVSDPAREADLLSRMGKLTPYLASTGQQLLRSKHPVAKMFSKTVLENTTGAGGRRTSASIDKYMSERAYFTPVEGFEANYKNWRRANGYTFFADAISQKPSGRFNQELTQYMAAVQRGETPDVHPTIKNAADMLEQSYAMAAREMKAVGAAGSKNLPNSSKGYFPRRLSAAKVSAMSNNMQRALAREFERQLEDTLKDPKIRKEVANRIVNRMKVEAAGGVAPSPNVSSQSQLNLVRTALVEGGLPEAEASKILARMRVSGPSYTKKRLDLDLNSKITDPETGESFTLGNLYETNQIKLLQSYVHRASGETALAKRGIMGREGLDLIRESFIYGEDGTKLAGKELADAQRAFDQTASEMLGVPYGSMTNEARHEWMNNLRMLTASSRLGGMAFTQFAEYANGVPALGVAASLRSIKAFPRMISELRSGKENPILNSIELVGGEFGGEYKQIFPFADANDMYVVGGEEVSVLSRSIREASRKMQFYNMFHHVAAAQTRGMSEQILSKALKAVRDGKNDVRLDDMGIDAELRAGLKKNLNKIAKFDDNGNLLSVDVSELDPVLTHRLATAVNRGAKQIIQGNFVGETGFWAANDLLKLLTQFRAFSLTSTEKQWSRIAGSQGTVKALGYLLGSVSFAIPIHLARVQLVSLGKENRDEYIKQQTELMAMARSVTNYLSLTGMFTDVMDLGVAGLGAVDSTFGTSLQPESAQVRGKGSSLASMVPALGYVEDTMDYLKDPTDIGKLVKQLPGGNLPYLMPAINSLKNDGEKDDGPI